MNITNFITWFIAQFVRIGQNILGHLDNIKIYNTVSLLDFTITIVIIGAFLSIILTIPQNAMNTVERKSKRIREREKKNEK